MPDELPNQQFNDWFMLYHKYSRKTYRDAEALAVFASDLEWAAQHNIGLLIIVDYHTNYPEYLSFWSRETLREMVSIAHSNGVKVIPYTSPGYIDVSSILYRIYGQEWTVKHASPFLAGETFIPYGWRSDIDGHAYRRDYRGEALVTVQACAATSWRDHYLAMVRGLLEEGFDGMYIDQHQEGVECVEHPEVNDAAREMLGEMRRLVKDADPDNLIVANIMSAHPDAHHPEFVERTKVADYGLTESLDWDITENLRAWIERTGLRFFFHSHGNYDSHLTKVRQAAALGQPLSLFTPGRLCDMDPKIRRLYEGDTANLLAEAGAE